MLTVQDSRLVLITLEGLENILKVGESDARSNEGVNQVAMLIEEAYGKYTCMCLCIIIIHENIKEPQLPRLQTASIRPRC